MCIRDRLSLSISMSDEAERELWEVSCQDVVEESISSVNEESLVVLSDSPLLIPYSEMEVDVYFSDNSCEPAFLLGCIFNSCVEVFGKGEYLHRFINLNPTVSGIVSSKHGKLGRYPKSVAERILDTLKSHPIQIKMLNENLPKQWAGSEFIVYPPLKVLVSGASYVIGEKFSAIRA